MRKTLRRILFREESCLPDGGDEFQKIMAILKLSPNLVNIVELAEIGNIFNPFYSLSAIQYHKISILCLGRLVADGIDSQISGRHWETVAIDPITSFLG